MDGHVIRETASYRQGLVLGLTMAEIILLLVFCLLIAMATFVRSGQEQNKKLQGQLLIAQNAAIADRAFIDALKANPDLYNKLGQATIAGDSKQIDEFWRELVESRAVISSLQKEGLSLSEISQRAIEGKKLRERGIDFVKASRDAEIVGSIGKRFPQATDPSKPPKEVIEAINASMNGGSRPGHQWPPMIKLSEAEGYSFESGSAQLSLKLQQELTESTPQKIAQLIKQYDVNVIEVVGHTDEQPLGVRQSNLDRDLLTALSSNAGVAGLVPADNAGLGLARAVSVVNVLRTSSALAHLSIIPLSGAQLVNTDERLATGANSGDVPQRRRIEIRLRKADREEVGVNAQPPPETTATAKPVKRPIKRQPPPTNPFPKPL